LVGTSSQQLPLQGEFEILTQTAECGDDDKVFFSDVIIK
jgi:hypothetical protein